MAWNGSGNAATSTVAKKKIAKPRKVSKGAPMSGAFKGTLALILVIIIGAGAYWFAANDGVKAKVIEKVPKKQIVEATADIAESIEEPEKIQPETKKREWTPEQIAIREKLKKMTPEERREFGYEMIKNRKIDLTPTKDRPFRTGIENSMAKIFMTKLGNPPPPPLTTMIPIQDEAHLAEILIANNPALDTDSEEIVEAKEMVELAKKEMAQYIKEGGDAESFLSYYYDKLQSAFEERRIALKEVARVSMEEPELAQEFFEQVNKRLIDKGIRGIDFTDSQKARLGLR